MNLVSLVVSRIRYIFPRPESRLIELLPSLRQLKADMRLARTIDHPSGINLFYDVMFEWWRDKRIADLVSELKKVRNQERDEIIGYLVVIHDQISEVNMINDRFGWRDINEPGDVQEVLTRQSRNFMDQYVSLVTISIMKLEEISEGLKS